MPDTLVQTAVFRLSASLLAPLSTSVGSLTGLCSHSSDRPHPFAFSLSPIPHPRTSLNSDPPLISLFSKTFMYLLFPKYFLQKVLRTRNCFILFCLTQDRKPFVVLVIYYSHVNIQWTALNLYLSPLLPLFPHHLTTVRLFESLWAFSSYCGQLSFLYLLCYF